ncbi:hypothetical protein F8S13_25240 [Chloroflexia bacterium SDU3-3]|nr:hypothetical protein F8S13_25240 [Chloroflexia bacterium SDU3-3]
MYGFFLGLHNVTRWLVLFAAVYALYVAYSGWLGKKAYGKETRRAGMIYANVTGVQLILGLLTMFWPGSLIMSVLGNAGFGAAMKNADVRYFLVEHPVIMLVAIGLLHMGTGIARRAPTDEAKYKRLVIFFTIATLLIIVGIPWGRRLLPSL